MHQTIPVVAHPPPFTAVGGNCGGNATDLAKTVSESAVIVVGARGCCMCQVVQKLLQGLGVNPPVYEVDERDVDDVAVVLFRKFVDSNHDNYSIDGGKVQFPAVFVGGKLFGGLERVMATHISGELVPTLKDVGALWL